MLFQRQVYMNPFHWQTCKYTYTQTKTCAHSSTYWNFQFWKTMWSCFHWMFVYLLSLPHPRIFTSQFPYKSWIHRCLWKVLKWWFQWLSIVVWESEKKIQNTELFPLSQLLDLGHISWHLTTLFPLISSENISVHSVEETHMNLCTTCCKQRTSAYLYDQVCRPRKNGHIQQ